MTDIKNTDCIVAGAGFCGSVAARIFAEAGKKTLVLERRSHIAGNMYDEIDSNGILVQRYGPHIFHTNSKEAYEFITRYSEWIPYRHRCSVVINNVVTPSPANFITIDLLYDKSEAEALKTALSNQYRGKKSVTILELLECKNITIKNYAEKLYELNYRPYTIKQWGIQPEKIDPIILKRVPVRLDYTDGYFDDTYQVLPKDGYTSFFKKLLDHKNITVSLNTDAADVLKADVYKKQITIDGKKTLIPVIYTGSADELLDSRYGQLPYRSLVFDFHTKSVDSFQDAPVVAHPAADGFLRITEFKKLPPQKVPDITTVAYDYPVPASRISKKEQYYPVLTEDNKLLYKKYHNELSKIPNLHLCGRLADYKYYDMDESVLRALEISKKIGFPFGKAE